MKMDHIDISGITPQSNFPQCPCNYPCKEICETHKLCVPNCKPCVETILQLFIDTSIDKSHVLYTSMGKKLVIYGNIHIKILYVAKTSCQSVHSAHFDIPFCTFILSSNICRQIEDISLFVEDVFIKQIDSRNFYVSIISLIYPVFKKQDDNLSSNFNKKNFNYIRSSVGSDSEFSSQLTTTPKSFNDLSSNEQSYSGYNMNTNKHPEIQYTMPKNNPTENEYEYEIEYEIEFDKDSGYNLESDSSCRNSHNSESVGDSSTDYMIPPKKHHENNYKMTDKDYEDIEYDNEYDVEYNMNYDMNSPKNISVNHDIDKEHFEYEWE